MGLLPIPRSRIYLGTRIDLLGLVFKHVDDMSAQIFLDFSMPWNRLGYFRPLVLIPVVFGAMTYEYASRLFQFFDQIPSFHATFSSATFRTQGILPLVSS